MNSLNHLVSPALLRAMGYTLLHSLWQGAVLALVVALLLSCLRQQAAVVRYRVAAIGLTALVGLAAVTFGYYYATMPPAELLTSQALSPAGYAAAVARAHHPLVAVSPTDWHGWVDGATSYLEQHLQVVVALWLLGFTITLGRLGLALRYVQRLRRHRLGAVPAVWQECLARLSARAGLVRPVQLRVSALVPSPLVVGHFKPLILLPLGLLSGLTGAELEMILAHELAHIVRKDYLFNLGQAVAETVFFYHPAVWFLAAVLHAERENCCDDLATSVGGHPRELARALVALAELTHAAPTPRLTLAVAGLHYSLLSRVQRLVHVRPAKTNGFFPASFALLGVGLMLAAVLISAQVAKLPTHTTLTRARRATTTKQTPDDAPRTGHIPLATSDEELQAFFQRQLQADGLLLDADNYVLTLTSSQLLVDGQPQSAALVARYQQLYEAATGYRMTATTSYQTRNEVVYQVAREPVVTATASPPDTAHAALLQQLHRDGLLTGGDTRPFQVEITKTGAFLVNGRARPPHLLRRYRALLGLPADSAGRTTAFALAVR